MAFSKEMLSAKEELTDKGFTVWIPDDAQVHVDNPDLADDFKENFKHATETDIMWKCFDKVAKSDAVLALNYPKNNTEGYIGTSTRMEIALAYYFKKHLFLLNNFPSEEECRWAHEIKIMNPTVLDGSFEKLVSLLNS